MCTKYFCAIIIDLFLKKHIGRIVSFNKEQENVLLVDAIFCKSLVRTAIMWHMYVY